MAVTINRNQLSTQGISALMNQIKTRGVEQQAVFKAQGTGNDPIEAEVKADRPRLTDRAPIPGSGQDFAVSTVSLAKPNPTADAPAPVNSGGANPVAAQQSQDAASANTQTQKATGGNAESRLNEAVVSLEAFRKQSASTTPPAQESVVNSSNAKFAESLSNAQASGSGTDVRAQEQLDESNKLYQQIQAGVQSQQAGNGTLGLPNQRSSQSLSLFG